MTEPPLRLAFDPDFPPLTFLADGRPAGRALERVRAAARVAGLDVEFVPLALDRQAGAVESGAVDGLACAAITSQRATLYVFSRPILRTAAGLFCRADWEGDLVLGAPRAPTTPATPDARGVNSVATPSGGPLTAQISSEHPGVRVVPVVGYREALEAVLAGDADAAALNAEVGAHLAELWFPGRFLGPGPAIFELDLAVALARGGSRREGVIERLNLGIA